MTDRRAPRPATEADLQAMTSAEALRRLVPDAAQAWREDAAAAVRDLLDAALEREP